MQAARTRPHFLLSRIITGGASGLAAGILVISIFFEHPEVPLMLVCTPLIVMGLIIGASRLCPAFKLWISLGILTLSALFGLAFVKGRDLVLEKQRRQVAQYLLPRDRETLQISQHYSRGDGLKHPASVVFHFSSNKNFDEIVHFYDRRFTEKKWNIVWTPDSSGGLWRSDSTLVQLALKNSENGSLEYSVSVSFEGGWLHDLFGSKGS